MNFKSVCVVSVCRFPVNSDGNGVITIPLDECVQEWELGVLFIFHGKLCLGVKAVDVLKKVMWVGFSYNRDDIINMAFPNTRRYETADHCWKYNHDFD